MGNVKSGDEMPPGKSGENMEKTTLRLPEALLADYRAIALRRGIDVSAVLREGLEEGLPNVLSRESAKLEYENKTLVNRKLKLSISRLEEGKAPDDL
ncbi:MAG: hypothetical protein LH679_05320 [Cyanobacteria bacterium CAN_BIN43]|jgi:hypothetical protein|nr:hypothetical protein [Cyanobacteria bacterium CAN_BIN43]